jgi:hypothetical protein
MPSGECKLKRNTTMQILSGQNSKHGQIQVLGECGTTETPLHCRKECKMLQTRWVLAW